MADLHFAARMRDFGGKVDLAAFTLDGFGDRAAVARAVVFDMQKLDFPDAEIDESTLTLRREEARSLMDALWHAGVRPTGIDTSDSEKRALASHLADMRAIAFHHVGVPKP